MVVCCLALNGAECEAQGAMKTLQIVSLFFSPPESLALFLLSCCCGRAIELVSEDFH